MASLTRLLPFCRRNRTMPGWLVPSKWMMPLTMNLSLVNNGLIKSILLAIAIIWGAVDCIVGRQLKKLVI